MFKSATFVFRQGPHVRNTLAGVLFGISVAACSTSSPNASDGDTNGGNGGQSGGNAGSGGNGTATACRPNPGRSPLRRLNVNEYRNTIRDLLPTVSGVINKTVDAFPLDEEKLGFSNNADALTVTGILAESYLTAAEVFATEATTAANLAKVVPCDPAKGDDACGQAFVASFGKRAFRRSLTSEETTRYNGIFAEGKKDGFSQGIELTLEAMLGSSNFIYRIEKGTQVAGGKTAQLTHHEMATRLSYFLWGSMPDTGLFDAAAANKLGTRDEIETQARRMLADPKAKQAVANFHEQWLAISAIGSKAKDQTLFPDWTRQVVNGMFQEASAFVDYVYWTEGKSEKLFTAPYTFTNPDLAKFYGMPAPAGTAFTKTNVDVSQRSGILTQGALMAIFSYENQTSPIHRGKFVREHLLCQELPSPSPEVAAKLKPPMITPGVTTRERFAQHEAEPSCAACHKAMDPIGLGFEKFDPIGRWRTKEGSNDISAAGELTAADVEGKFDGAVELGAKLATSKDVRDCIVTQWFRFATGRAETEFSPSAPDEPSDQCALDAIKQAFEDGGHDMKEIAVKIAASDTFRFRSTSGGGL